MEISQCGSPEGCGVRVWRVWRVWRVQTANSVAQWGWLEKGERVEGWREGGSWCALTALWPLGRTVRFDLIAEWSREASGRRGDAVPDDR